MRCLPDNQKRKITTIKDLSKTIKENQGIQLGLFAQTILHKLMLMEDATLNKTSTPSNIDMNLYNFENASDAYTKLKYLVNQGLSNKVPTVSATLTAVTTAASAVEMEESSTTDDDDSVSPPPPPPSRKAVRRAAVAGPSRAGPSRAAAVAGSVPRTRVAPTLQAGSAGCPILLEQETDESDAVDSDALTTEVFYLSESESSTNVSVPKASKAKQHFESIKAEMSNIATTDFRGYCASVLNSIIKGIHRDTSVSFLGKGAMSSTALLDLVASIDASRKAIQYEKFVQQICLLCFKMALVLNNTSVGVIFGATKLYQKCSAYDRQATYLVQAIRTFGFGCLLLPCFSMTRLASYNSERFEKLIQHCQQLQFKEKLAALDFFLRIDQE